MMELSLLEMASKCFKLKYEEKKRSKMVLPERLNKIDPVTSMCSVTTLAQNAYLGGCAILTYTVSPN